MPLTQGQKCGLKRAAFLGLYGQCKVLLKMYSRHQFFQCRIVRQADDGESVLLNSLSSLLRADLIKQSKQTSLSTARFS